MSKTTAININSKNTYKQIVAAMGLYIADLCAEQVKERGICNRFEITEQAIMGSQYFELTRYHSPILRYSDNPNHALEMDLVYPSGFKTSADLVQCLAFWAMVADVNDWFIS